jgi:hypothetical protein
MRWTLLLAPLCIVLMGFGGKAQLVTAEQRILANAKVDAQLHRVLNRLLVQERHGRVVTASR